MSGSAQLVEKLVAYQVLQLRSTESGLVEIGCLVCSWPGQIDQFLTICFTGFQRADGLVSLWEEAFVLFGCAY
jgi:hypothetical protein